MPKHSGRIELLYGPVKGIYILLKLSSLYFFFSFQQDFLEARGIRGHFL